MDEQEKPEESSKENEYDLEAIIRRQLESAPATDVAGIGEFDPTSQWEEQPATEEKTEEKQEQQSVQEPAQEPVQEIAELQPKPQSPPPVKTAETVPVPTTPAGQNFEEILKNRERALEAAVQQSTQQATLQESAPQEPTLPEDTVVQQKAAPSQPGKPNPKKGGFHISANRKNDHVFSI